ncbi:hypothetical protein [Staphylococcus marylandisciuri]|uniref:hypothetical protein n=1 Tax=Staphylococcus marylandisciuri TaxID=2981529 RepID=UPI0021D2A184|nr:hypothetical protein [Staphylococcus marylandisciuri]
MSRGPQQRETGKPVSTSYASWGGAPTQRNWFISFYKHSKLGWGPNTKKLVYQFPPAMRVGVGPQQRETGKPVSTSTASWGGTTKSFYSN